MSNDDFIQDALDLNKEIKEKVLPRFNLLELAGISERENKVSDQIAYLLREDIRLKNRKNELIPLGFAEKFLELLKNEGLGLEGESLSHIKREKQIENERRIDLFLETEKSEIIIIENKINSGYSNNQLNYYVEWALKRKCRVFLVCLSRECKPSANIPLCQKLKEELGNSGGYVSIGYDPHIHKLLCEVLKDMNELCNDNNIVNPDLVRSGIIQLKDSIEGFCGMRENGSGIIMQHYFDKYFPRSEDNTQCKDLMEAAYTISKGMHAVVLVRFLSDLVKELSVFLPSEEIFFTHKNQRFESNYFETFIKSIQSNINGIQSNINGIQSNINGIQSNINGVGVEVSLLGRKDFGLGMEFSSLTKNSELYFGFKSNKENQEKTEVQDQDIQNIISQAKWPDPAVPPRTGNKTGWYKYMRYTPGRWFHQALFYKKANKNWQKKDRALAHHVAKGWMEPIINDIKNPG